VSTNGRNVPSSSCGEVEFASADTAYVLAYSIIMLNTDAHNPMVKNKMTREGFQKNNRGINGGGDLPAEFLSEIYERITTNQIRMKDDDSGSLTTMQSSVLTPKQKQMLFQSEAELMLKRSQEAVNLVKREHSVFHSATTGYHARELMAVGWAPILATASVLLEQASDSEHEWAILPLCMDAFKHSIHVLSIFYMETERDAYVSALAKFTQLNSIKEMTQKNVECVKALISVAQADGNYLGRSWHSVRAARRARAFRHAASVWIDGLTRV
jgi:brefeldin A-inhibited guanine nucleotide-exchange protein